MKLYRMLDKYVAEVVNQSNLINTERKIILDEFSEIIIKELKTRSECNLTFICTHNSRRSQFCQVWARVAADYFNINNINCYSGGTEVTAFNHRAVQALLRVGFEISQTHDEQNPFYKISYSGDKNPAECFSKVYNDKYNPQKDYIAVMTCSHADENCPVVFGALERVAVRYTDPKEFDDTASEAIKYDEKSKEIAAEMFYVFSKLQNL